MPLFWWILSVVVWVAIAFWPARVAGRKGHSFIGYFIFSLFDFQTGAVEPFVHYQAPLSKRAHRPAA